MNPPGLDLARLRPWLPGAGDHLSASLITGGKSNLTYDVTDGVQSWIVRRPPLGHVLPTAHDMAREFRVMAALQSTPVPVPRTFRLCEVAEVVGAPFYVMEKVPGRPYRFVSDIAPLGPERTRAISESLVDTLAGLHQVDPRAVGLHDLGRPEGFLARQVSRWKEQLTASYTRDLPSADELYRKLSANVPPASAPGIVHGDYRLDNVLTDETDRLTAVIDWEMATIGDPLTDLALLVIYGRLAQTAGDQIANVTSAPGFLSETEIIDRYSISSPRDLSRFAFYLGLASFKLAAILEGIHYRYVHGQTVGEGFLHVGEAITTLLDGGHRALTHGIKEYR